MQEINQTVLSAYKLWDQSKNTEKLFQKDASLWTNNDEIQWMGWLKLPILNEREIASLQSLARELQGQKFSHILLLGMGGSSLFPDLMAKIFNKKSYPELVILDSTDPLQITHIENKIDLKKTFVIISSKSGNTLESHLLLEYIYDKLKKIHQSDSVGKYFFAITDPGSKLEKYSKDNQFKAIFTGLPSIGGRYSALSAFGLVPLALMDADIDQFLKPAEKMFKQCRETKNCADNPGVSLGIQLGVFGMHGKNKITFVMPEKLRSFAAWLEQLIAESSGKNDKVLLPIVDEPLASPDYYADDRIFVSISLESFSENDHGKLTLLEKKGHPVIKIHLSNIDQLSGEIYRFEIATAVACSILGVNPFNQPDVETTKIKTHQIMESPNNSHELVTPSNETVKLFFNSIKIYDYFSICAFLEMSDEIEMLLQKIRIWVRDKKQVATTLGFGPRFLHSTGQAHKGGTNTGVFLQFVREYSSSEDINLADKTLSFGKVIRAQAMADFQVLKEKSRRVLQINLGTDPITELKRFLSNLENSDE